ncbi:MAG TPA: T9SS type A sorting domain-containing protein, partial [bacterium]|nr:T9SS type A sorting domain-containing protein [bacterium]
AFQLSRPAPNPAVGAAEVRFTVGRAGPVRLDVYDVLGRQVRNLTDGVREPETYLVRWDGNDERGRRVGSGVYFYRLSAPGFEQVRKMTLLR